MRRLIAVLAIACGCAFAQSQEPPPSGGVTSQPQQTHPTNSQQPTANNQQRASQPPIIVNVLPATNTEGEAAEERRERHEKAALDRRLVEWTVQLALFTAGLFAATIALFIATCVLGYFAYRQSCDMRASIATAEAANKISRENMIASRRAWIAIEDVKLKQPTVFTEEGITFAVDITLKNLGQTPATRVWVDATCYFIKNNSERFIDAEKRFKAAVRANVTNVGHILFPQDTPVQTLIWVDGQEKIRDAIEVRCSGERDIDVMVFVAVSYRIVGDDTPHITHHVHTMLNIPIGTAIPMEQMVDLPRAAFRW